MSHAAPTDYIGVRALILAEATTEVLLAEAARLESLQVTGVPGVFTAALGDDERDYLDVMAALYARGAMPLLPGREDGCPSPRKD